MKLIKWLFVLVLPWMFYNAQAQPVVRYYNVKNLFVGSYPTTAAKDTIWEQYKWYDSWRNYSVFYTISSDTTLDSMKTAIMNNRFKYSDMFITFGVIQDTIHDADDHKDTIDVKLNMGVFRGYGFGSPDDQTTPLRVDSSGWQEYNIGGFSNVVTATTPDTTLAVTLADSTWWTDYPTTMWYFEIVELDTSKNRYFLNVFQFGED